MLTPLRGRVATTVVATSGLTLLCEAIGPRQAASAAGYELTTGRAGASASALIALVGVVLGATALVRSRRQTHAGQTDAGQTDAREPGAGLTGARVACAAGLVGLLGGGAVVATADGGPGTGSGIAGAVVAVALSLVAIALGSVAITRRRPERHAE